MPEKSCAIILAAGEGKRMRSNRPKVLTEVLFKPMLQWVMDAARRAGVQDVCVVAGHMHEMVEDFVKGKGVECALQLERRGTGHAVMMASDFLNRHRGWNVLVLSGDAPFMSDEFIEKAYWDHVDNGRAATVISAELADPTGYGRIVRDRRTGLVAAIVEQKDADAETKEIREINSGTYWFQVDALLDILQHITSDNAQGEYYLTDAIKLLIQRRKRAGAFIAGNPDMVLGANDCVQLNRLNELARASVLHQLMLEGVEIPCRDGVIVGPDVQVGAATRILPGTILRGNTRVGGGCVLGPNTILTDVTAGDGCVLDSVRLTGRQVAPGTVVEPAETQL